MSLRFSTCSHALIQRKPVTKYSRRMKFSPDLRDFSEKGGIFRVLCKPEIAHSHLWAGLCVDWAGY